MKKIEQYINKLSNVIGWMLAILLVLMMLNVAFDTLARYLFRVNYIAMQEMEWHLFSIITLLGISYTLLEEGHVRVDVISMRFSDKTKCIINMVGAVLFILPLSILIIIGSLDFVKDSFIFMEKSGDPGGLPYRFVIKSLIPISFIFMVISSVGYFARNYNNLVRVNAGKSVEATRHEEML